MPRDDLGRLDRPLCFSLMSCQYPAGVLDVSARESTLRSEPDLRVGPADASLIRLGLRFKKRQGEPTFAVSTGDQVYVDATAGLFDPALLDDALRFAYERSEESFGARFFKAQCGPYFSLFDDHELRDNWANALPALKGEDNEELQKALAQYWRARRRQGNWPFDIVDFRPGRPALYLNAAQQGFPFFLGDTRTERPSRTFENWRETSIMRKRQMDYIRAWIGRHGRSTGGAPRFIVTSSIVLPRRLATQREAACALQEDTWPGFPSSLHALLATLCDKEANNVVLLSGDEHQGCVTKIRLSSRDNKTGDTKKACIYSVHAPALYAPYPFANSTPDDFARVDHDTFKKGDVDYEYHVDTWYPPSENGFAVLRTQQDDQGAWQLGVEYDLTSGTCGPGPLTLGV